MDIYDIAEKAKVSTATVSRVLNNKKNVSEKTRQKVLSVMSDMEFTPNIFARGLNINSIKMIGVMCSEVTDIYYATAVSVIEKEARENGFDVILCCTGDSLANKKKSLSILLSKRVDAIILVGSIFKEFSDNSHVLEASKQVPLVIINGLFDFPNTYSILCNESEAMRIAVNCLTQKGIREILFLYGSDTFSGLEKLAGLKAGLADAGIPFSKSHVIKCERSIQSAAETFLHAKSLLSFSAVITSDSIIAVGALKSALKLGLSVPEEMSVIGFDNNVLSVCSIPEITSVDSKVEALSSIAVKTVIDVLAKKNTPQKIILSAQLIERETTL